MPGEQYPYHYDDRRHFEQHAITMTVAGWRVVSVQDAPNGSVDAWYERSSPVAPSQQYAVTQPAPRTDISPYAPPRAAPPIQAMQPIPYQPPMQVQTYHVSIPPQPIQPPQYTAHYTQSTNYMQPVVPPVQTIVLIGQKSPNLLLRLLYFVCIGWWVSFIW